MPYEEGEEIIHFNPTVPRALPKELRYEGMQVEYRPATMPRGWPLKEAMDVALWAKEMKMLTDVRERIYVIYVNNKLDPIGYRLIGSGGLNECLADMRVIFGPAMALHAYGIFLVHNHPSGSLAQSPNDDALFQRLDQIGKVMGVTVIDSIIVSRMGVRSSAAGTLTRFPGAVQQNPLDEPDYRPDRDYDPRQLRLGIRTEMEHTHDRATAKTIAKDHLDEIPDYYDRLLEMEREAEDLG